MTIITRYKRLKTIKQYTYEGNPGTSGQMHIAFYIYVVCKENLDTVVLVLAKK